MGNTKEVGVIFEMDLGKFWVTKEITSCCDIKSSIVLESTHEASG